MNPPHGAANPSLPVPPLTPPAQATEAPPPDEAVRRLILAGDFGGAAQRLESLCPALAENQWLQFQFKRHKFLLLAARATAPTSEGGPDARAQQLQQALGASC